MVGQDIRTTTAGRRAVGPGGQEQADALAGPGTRRGARHTQGRQQGARGAHKADASGDRQDLRRHVRMPKAAHPACVPGEVVAVLCAAGTREPSPILSVRRRVRPHTAWRVRFFPPTFPPLSIFYENRMFIITLYCTTYSNYTL